MSYCKLNHPQPGRRQDSCTFKYWSGKSLKKGTSRFITRGEAKASASFFKVKLNPNLYHVEFSFMVKKKVIVKKKQKQSLMHQNHLLNKKKTKAFETFVL